MLHKLIFQIIWNICVIITVKIDFLFYRVFINAPLIQFCYLIFVFCLYLFFFSAGFIVDCLGDSQSDNNFNSSITNSDEFRTIPSIGKSGEYLTIPPIEKSGEFVAIPKSGGSQEYVTIPSHSTSTDFSTIPTQVNTGEVSTIIPQSSPTDETSLKVEKSSRHVKFAPDTKTHDHGPIMHAPRKKVQTVSFDSSSSDDLKPADDPFVGGWLTLFVWLVVATGLVSGPKGRHDSDED